MARFKLVSKAPHTHFGQKIEHGDVIETDLDMPALFPNKFEEVSDEGKKKPVIKLTGKKTALGEEVFDEEPETTEVKPETVGEETATGEEPVKKKKKKKKVVPE